MSDVGDLIEALEADVAQLRRDLFLAREEARQLREVARIGAEAIEREPGRVKRAFVEGVHWGWRRPQIPSPQKEAARRLAEGTL